MTRKGLIDADKISADHSFRANLRPLWKSTSPETLSNLTLVLPFCYTLFLCSAVAVSLLAGR